MHNNIIKKLLNLEGVSIENIKNLPGELQIQVSMPVVQCNCPKCNSTSIKIHDYRIQKIKDAPIRDTAVTILYRKRRYLCKSCGKKFYEPNNIVAGYHRLSKRLIAYVVEKLSTMSSAKNISDSANISPNLISRLLPCLAIPRKPLERKYCKHSRHLLLSNHERLNERNCEELLFILTNYSEDLRLAYKEKELFISIVSSNEPYEDKVKLLKDWIWRNLNSDIPELVECAKTFQHWFQAIRNSLAVPYSNGPIEGKNNKIKVLKRITYGMKKFVNFKARILLACS